MEQNSWSNNYWKPSLNKASILGKGLGDKAPGVKYSWFGIGIRGITLGCPEEGLVPESGLTCGWKIPSESVKIQLRPGLSNLRWQRPRSVQNSRGKAKEAMPLRTSSHGKAPE
jgi:hypothetical protein